MPARDNAPTGYDELIRLVEILPDLVREKRRRLRMSLRKAAKETDVSFSTIHRLEQGDSDLHTENLLKLIRWVSS